MAPQKNVQPHRIKMTTGQKVETDNAAVPVEHMGVLIVPPNLRAFLGMIAISEIGADLLAASDDGYDVIVGSTVTKPDLFDGYVDHPRKLVWLPKLRVWSTAAGRYQILFRYFDAYKKQLALPDYGRDSQDRIAVQMIKECRALTLIESGKIAEAISACRSRWASLPGAGYGQRENALQPLLAAYRAAGGEVAA